MSNITSSSFLIPVFFRSLQTRNKTTMAFPTTFKAIHLQSRPKDEITSDTFTLKEHSTTSSLKDGEILFQSNYLSLDPAMRGWLNDSRSYIPPVKIGAVMRGAGVGTVLASKSSLFSPGEIVYAHSGWTELAVLREKEVEKIELPSNGKMTDALGVLGMTGLTAYFGILDVGKVKAGDFVVVSGAAGATGSVVGQIAKIKGATVLGLAGSDEKCRWLVEELGFDQALNYKDAQFRKKFRAATKQLIDVYFDNVGGEILDLALARAKEHSRFVMCGGELVLHLPSFNVLTSPRYQSIQYEERSRSEELSHDCIHENSDGRVCRV
jgi:NADPH-dependent curcumin reductase CurA